MVPAGEGFSGRMSRAPGPMEANHALPWRLCFLPGAAGGPEIFIRLILPIAARAISER